MRATQLGSARLQTSCAGITWVARTSRAMTSWGGLSPVPIRREVVPFHVLALDEIHLPFALVLLEARFAMDGRTDIGEGFEIHKELHAVFLRETGYESLLVLPYPALKIIGDSVPFRRLARM